ncbi:MAG TPA: Hsp70 family protein [Stellaceae bacterium]|nr:Hsp70 family protein [Stellaceae bacterium]
MRALVDKPLRYLLSLAEPKLPAADRWGLALGAVVGVAARERVQGHPERSAAVFKRYMGSERKLVLAGREFRPEELSALVPRALKADAEAFLGETVDEAIVTVPAYFNDTQRKATRITGELAGRTVQRLLNEPTAAALAYGLQEAMRESKFLVFDLGGGTFDVAVLELFEGVIEVRATAGDNFLGGEDFVDAIVEWFPRAAKLPLPPAESNPAPGAQLRRQAEAAMRRLSEAEETEIAVTWKERGYAAKLSRDTFQRLAEPLMQRLRRPIERALHDARIKPGEPTHVVLAGGATRMPMERGAPDRAFAFPADDNQRMSPISPDVPISVDLPLKTRFVTVQLFFKDGTISSIERYDVPPDPTKYYC